jgi:putative DNA methylase
VIHRRLIEEELPIERVNVESGREKSLRHGNISTSHLWWARRPLAMSRAVVAGVLIPDPEDEEVRTGLLDAIADAARFENSGRAEVLRPIRDAISAAHPDGRPKVLDCFAGGGAIPLEAVRLGCDTTALDLNPVAHLVELATLDFPQRFGAPSVLGQNAFVEEFRQWSRWVHGQVSERVRHLFPSSPGLGRSPLVYFWCRTMPCGNPDCRAEVPLVTSWWLARGSRRTAWVECVLGIGPAPRKYRLTVRTGSPSATADPDIGTVKAGSVTCRCGFSLSGSDTRRWAKRHKFGYRLYAVMDGGQLRSYRDPVESEEPDLRAIAVMLDDLPELDDGTSALPDEAADDIGYRNLQQLPYGYDTWRSMFHERQLMVLAAFTEAVRAAHQEMLRSGIEEARARALATYLGLTVDRIADYNSTFISWAPGGEFVRSTFPQQTIRMVWDFVEINPLLDGPGSWDGAVVWMALAVEHCSQSSRTPARVIRGNAQRMPFGDSEFDAVIVDPPYYFSVMYSDLSDFFYVWLKRSIGHLYPGLFATKWTPKDEEVVQNRCAPSNPRHISAEEFELRLSRSLQEIARVVKPEGIVAIVFAHTDVVAWEKLLLALRTAGLSVTTSWPMRSEREGRATSGVKAVLGSSIVLVCRKLPARGEAFFDDVVRELEARIAARLDRFVGMGLVGADYFASAVGPAFEVFAQYERVTRLSGAEVTIPELMELARLAVARRAMARLLGDVSISALDSVSLLYLTWRWAYGREAIPADEAYKLERAFDVDLSGLEGPAGLVEKGGGKLSLRGPDDRRGLRLSANPLLIDVLQQACLLWDAGRRRELEGMLADTGRSDDRAFWSMARALAEVLPEGDRERTMLLGLTGSQDTLANAAAKMARPVQTTLEI